MAHPLLSFPFKGVFRIALLICLFHHTIFALTLLPAVAAPHALQPNGVICSPYFGAPLLADCQNAILQHEATISNSPYRLLVSVLGNDNRSENPLLLPRVFYNGTCILTINIVNGGRNNVPGRVLSEIAQAIAPTCASLSESQGGWGAYADVAVIIASADSNFSSAVWSNATSSPPPSSSSSSPSQSPKVTGSKELAYFWGSYWAGNSTAVNPTGLPGYSITDQWQFPDSVYWPYKASERPRCGRGTTSDCDVSDAAACCEGSACARRLLPVPGGAVVAKRCVSLGLVQPTTRVKGDTTEVDFEPFDPSPSDESGSGWNKRGEENGGVPLQRI